MTKEQKEKCIKDILTRPLLSCEIAQGICKYMCNEGCVLHNNVIKNCTDWRESKKRMFKRFKENVVKDMQNEIKETQEELQKYENCEDIYKENLQIYNEALLNKKQNIIDNIMKLYEIESHLTKPFESYTKRLIWRNQKYIYKYINPLTQKIYDIRQNLKTYENPMNENYLYINLLRIKETISKKDELINNTKRKLEYLKSNLQTYLRLVNKKSS